MKQLLVERGTKVNDLVTFTMEECCNCGVPFMMPTSLQRTLINNHKSFYCPNGHPQSYVGKTEAQKLKDQLDQIERDKQIEIDNLQNLWLDSMNENRKLSKQLKRVHKGVCPCCNRTFIDLQRHMKSKHPEVANTPQ